MVFPGEHAADRRAHTAAFAWFAQYHSHFCGPNGQKKNRHLVLLRSNVQAGWPWASSSAWTDCDHLHWESLYAGRDLCALAYPKPDPGASSTSQKQVSSIIDATCCVSLAFAWCENLCCNCVLWAMFLLHPGWINSAAWINNSTAFKTSAEVSASLVHSEAGQSCPGYKLQTQL